jgi:Fic family protein
VLAYIYQLQDWPRFTWNRARLACPLADVRYRQGCLTGHLEALDPVLRKDITLRTLTTDVLKSSEIEDELLDAEQIRSAISSGPGSAIGLVEMTLDATGRFDEPLTEERLYRWHAFLFPGGRRGWRDDANGPMQVVSGPPGDEQLHYEAPPAARIDAEMRAFLHWFNAADSVEEDPVCTAGLAHLWFATIHPFDDGNGRIARTLADMWLARSEKSPQRFYSMSAQIRQERAEYYDILEQTQQETMDVTAWMEWFVGCLGRAVDAAQTEFGPVLDKARFWASVRGIPLSERQHLLLNQLLDGFEGHLTTSKFAKFAGCSEDTALRDILYLVERGVLVRGAEGGRSTNYGLKREP